MSDLKTEIIKHKASRILKYYNREGIRFNTALFDDENSVQQQEKNFLFLKYKTQEFSEEFAKAVISYDDTLDYHNMLVRQLAKESASKEGFLMFTKDVPVNEKEIAETESYINLTKTVLNTFIQKQDTPQFRENVNTMNDIFASDLNIVAEGDYGVVFFYKLNSHPEFQPENQQFLLQFSEQLKNQEQQRNQQINQQQLER